MEKSFNTIGLLINFCGALIMFIGTPKIEVSAFMYPDAGKEINDKRNKKIRTGFCLFCIGFFIQFVCSFF